MINFMESSRVIAHNCGARGGAQSNCKELNTLKFEPLSPDVLEIDTVK